MIALFVCWLFFIALLLVFMASATSLDDETELVDDGIPARRDARQAATGIVALRLRTHDHPESKAG